MAIKWGSVSSFPISLFGPDLTCACSVRTSQVAWFFFACMVGASFFVVFFFALHEFATFQQWSCRASSEGLIVPLSHLFRPSKYWNVNVAKDPSVSRIRNGSSAIFLHFQLLNESKRPKWIRGSETNSIVEFLAGAISPFSWPDVGFKAKIRLSPIRTCQMDYVPCCFVASATFPQQSSQNLMIVTS